MPLFPDSRASDRPRGDLARAPADHILVQRVQEGTPAVADDVPEPVPALPDLGDTLVTAPNALGGLQNLLTQQAEEVKDEQIKIKSPWRIERRGRKNTVGYAIFKRGTPPKYLGYVGEFSKSDKPDWFPTYQSVRRDGQRNS